MKKIISLWMALMLCLAMAGTAAAELTTTATMVKQFDHVAYDVMQRRTKLLSIPQNGAYVLVDSTGSIVTEKGYEQFNTVFGSFIPSFIYAQVASNESDNKWGLLNAEGKLITTDGYSNFWYKGEKWALGVVVEPTADGGTSIARIDAFCDGEFVTSFDWSYGFWSAYGDYLYLHNENDNRAGVIIHRSGTCTPINHDFLFGNEYRVDYPDRVWHYGSQQYAFEPGCTLTRDEVETWLIYNGKGQFIDVQGNVVCTTDEDLGTSVVFARVYHDQYIYLYSSSSGGYLFHMDGRLIVKADRLCGTTVPDGAPDGYLLSSGYQLCRDSEKNLYYVDADGNRPVDFTVPEAEIRSDSIVENLPFLISNRDADGKYTIYTAAAGKLDTRYDNLAYYGSSAGSRVLAVMKDGKYGVIDLYGNTVIDFCYDIIAVSLDGTMAAAVDYSTYCTHLYRIDYTDPAEEAAKAIWHCDPCNRDNDMNFCPSCGVAKPVKLVCSGCGYEPENQTFRFCPSCGQQF